MFVALLWACGEPASAPAPAPAPPPVAEAAAEPTPAPAEAQAPKPEADLTPARMAKVLEVIPTSAYTFARMDACGSEAWVAGPPTEVEVGQTVEMPEGMVMADFHAASLDRTFEAILFVDFMNVTDAEPACAPPVKATENQYVGRVVETTQGGGYTYARLDMCGEELWVAGPMLQLKAGQTLLAVKGNVMKGFSSPTLDRTFDEIAFVNKMKTVPGVPFCAPEPGADGAGGE